MGGWIHDFGRGGGGRGTVILKRSAFAYMGCMRTTILPFYEVGGRPRVGGGLTHQDQKENPTPYPPLLKAQLGGGKTLFP